MKTRKTMKVACAALAAVMTMGVVVGCGSGLEVPKFSKENINIGASGPLTGGAAIYGTAVYNAAKLAVKEINDAGGVKGIKLSFEMLDDAHDATKVPANYANLKDNGMQISLGCVTTKPCLQFKGDAVKDNMFVLTPSASGDDVAKDAPNVFQMCFTDSGQGAEAAKFVKKTYPDKNIKIGVLYKAGDEYSEGLYNNFVKELGENKGGYDVTVASFTAEEDFSSQVNTLKNCKFFFVPTYYGPASTFMLQAKGKVANDAIYFGCDGFDGIDAIEGFDINTIPQEVSMLSHFNSKATEGKAKDFVDKYNSTFTAKTDKGTLNQFGAAAYDCVYAIKAALEKTDKPFDASTKASDFCEILKEVLNSAEFSFSGATGTDVKWNADGTVDKSAVKYVIKNAD